MLEVFFRFILLFVWMMYPAKSPEVTLYVRRVLPDAFVVRYLPELEDLPWILFPLADLLVESRFQICRRRV